MRDNCTRFTRVYFLRHKSDAASAFESFLAEVRADGTPSAVMAVRSGNGVELFGRAFGELCRKRGIKQESTPADRPKYNGVAERALGLINDAAVAARIHATELYPNAPNYPSLWAEAASWAFHALNCTATTANPGDKSPYEMWYGSPPPRGAVWPFLKPAVCRVKRANKSLPKAQDCYYVGPGVNHPRDCMRVLTANRSILTTRNVTWRHVPLPPPAPPQQLSRIAEEGGSTAGEGASGEGAPSQGGGRVKEDLDGESDLDVTEVGPMLTATAETGARGGEVAEGDPAASSDSHGSNSTSSRISSSTNSRISSRSSNNTSTSRGDGSTLAGREAHRQRWDGKIPALQGGRTRSQSRQHQMSADIADALLTHARRTEEEDTATERVHDLLLEGRLEEEHKGRGKMMEWLEEDGPALERREEAQDPGCPLAMASEQDPQISTPAPIGKQPSEVESPPLSVAGVERSVYRKGWEEAMKLEFDGHIKTDTFSMVDRGPEGCKPVSSKWCFTYKTDKEGKITKLKARLVARGFTQIRDVDYTHSSSPCPSSASVKLILAVANEKGLPLRHFDVAQAYIRASLDEEVYMKLPGGCGEKSRKTTKLERVIYGLKQSGRKWGHLCADILIEHGFEQGKADPCVFRKVVDGAVVMIVGVYVDDLLIGESEEDCESLLASLNKKFSTNDLGECTWYDGCCIERDFELGTIKLSQEAYVESFMKRFDVQSISGLPASAGADLGPKEDDKPGGDWPVREAIGSLNVAIDHDPTGHHQRRAS